MGGGSDAPSTQTVNQVKELPEFAKPYAQDLLSTGMKAINTPIQEYAGMRVAPVNEAQQQGLAAMMGRATMGSPDEMMARQAATDTLSGAYFSANPAIQRQTYVPRNRFAGPNSYMDDMISRNAQDMAGAYATGTAAQTDAAASHAKAYGGSAHQELMQRNAGTLAKNIADMATNTRMQDYNMQQQLEESGIARGLQAQQFDRGLQDSSFQAERARQMQAIPLALQGSQVDYANAEKMLQAGDAQRANQQTLLDQMYQDYLTQANRPYEQIDRAGNLLGLAIGNTGSQTVRQSQPVSRYAPVAGFFGGGLAGYGMAAASNGAVNPWLGAAGGAALGGLAGMM